MTIQNDDKPSIHPKYDEQRTGQIIHTKATRALNTKKLYFYNMTTTAWKCYRCDLTFKEESHATLHKNICNHESRQIKIALA
ncbi:MAG TPA: hypothetical protein VD828_04125 [Candidatus Nitrosotenuis sp.]|nr:hypothetical protein [Candidatus Nitrosotenuis sp.]